MVETKTYNTDVYHGYQSFGLHANDRQSQKNKQTQLHNTNQSLSTSTTTKPLHHMNETTTTTMTSNGLEPYISRLERFELYSTNQCYYLIGCNKQNTAYRVIKMDRTLIERPPDYIIQQQQQKRYYGGEFHAQHSVQSPTQHGSSNQRMDQSSYHTLSMATSADGGTNNTIPGGGGTAATVQQQQQQQQQDGNSHTVKPTLRPLTDFLIEDPNVYTHEEINDMLDRIYDGNRTTALQQLPGHLTDRMTDNQQSNQGNATSPGLKPVVKAYGIVGFIRFLDCYYLTLITRRAKVGIIGGNSIFTIKSTETIPLKPAERIGRNGGGIGGAGVGVRNSGIGPGGGYMSGNHNNSTTDDGNYLLYPNTNDPSSVLLSMWNRGKRSVGLGLTNREIAELRYQGLFQVVDLTKNFYFSYTYELTRTVQENYCICSNKPIPPPPTKNMYEWNYFLTNTEFKQCLSNSTTSPYYWIMPLVHGAYVQRKLNDYGRTLDLILIARRSRHFAGTRYLKRGVSEQGKVANDVEHEQIVYDESSSPSTSSIGINNNDNSNSNNSTTNGTFSSYIQVRGSIPTFWTQESSVTMPKPPIEINRVDPTYTATQYHFADLLQRYSSPIVICDLVKQSERREREVRVGNEFRNAIDYINSSIYDTNYKIRYCALDYSHISKHRNLDVSTSLNEVATWAVNQTGFFCSDPIWKIESNGTTVSPFTDADREKALLLSKELGIPIFPMEQHGVLRTNCIDCLDRTNVAQFSAGVEAIGQQLVCMGIRSKAKLGPSSNIVRVLIDMYVDIGDSISIQYGGSEAHKKVQQAQSESNITGPIGKHKELLTSIRRYYSNAFTDRLKQDAMNLFLGYYLPYRHSVPLWEMENDYYLHNFHVIAGRGTNTTMKMYERAFGVEWDDDDDTLRGSRHSGSDLKKSTRPASPNNESFRRSNRQQLDYTAPTMKRNTESLRVLKVRERCKSQNATLSLWWRTALQLHFQQRIWMRRSSDECDADIPPRFDRIYQLDKLSQFDRFFARSWSTPVRSSHAAQHTDGLDDGDAFDFSRVISRDFSTTTTKIVGKKDTSSETDNDSGLAVNEFIKAWGFGSRKELTLKLFREHHLSPKSNSTQYSYIGDCDISSAEVKPEYLQYVAPSTEVFGPPDKYHSKRVDEFTSCLHDYTLESDDVLGIHKLAKSAHIGEKILQGPFKGLSKDESAIEVATVIQEQLNILESMPPHQQRSTGKDLIRNGLGSIGVLDSIGNGLRDFENSQTLYSEVTKADETMCERSDLTDPSSLMLYASYCDDNFKLHTSDQIFLNAYDASTTQSRSMSKSQVSIAAPAPFVKKAARLGIYIEPAAGPATDICPSVYRSHPKHEIPNGFEQINEDMYSRIDNKLMVFNGAGVESWSGNLPITKISDPLDILRRTL